MTACENGPFRLTMFHSQYAKDGSAFRQYEDEQEAITAAREWVSTNSETAWASLRHDTIPERTFTVWRDGERWGLWHLFQKDRVTDVSTVAEFLDKYYKYDRYKGRGEDYAACVLKSHSEDAVKNGYTIASRHESVTGKVVAFYPKEG